jgi:hypothetical protein
MPEQVGIAGHHLAMGIVDDLLAHPGLYLGVDHVVNADRAGAARIVITPLPGQAGVILDYGIFNPSTPLLPSSCWDTWNARSSDAATRGRP